MRNTFYQNIKKKTHPELLYSDFDKTRIPFHTFFFPYNPLRKNTEVKNLDLNFSFYFKFSQKTPHEDTFSHFTPSLQTKQRMVLRVGHLSLRMRRPFRADEKYQALTARHNS